MYRRVVSSRACPAISATSTTSAPERTRLVTQVWRSTWADDAGLAASAKPRITRSIARGLIRFPVRDSHNAVRGSSLRTALWLSRTGNRMSPRAIDLVIRGLADTARPASSAHVLRHTWVTNLVRSGADVVLV